MKIKDHQLYAENLPSVPIARFVSYSVTSSDHTRNLFVGLQSFFIIYPIPVKICFSPYRISLYDSPSSISGVHVTVDMLSSKVVCTHIRTINIYLIDIRRCNTQWKASEVTSALDGYHCWTTCCPYHITLFNQILATFISSDDCK